MQAIVSNAHNMVPFKWLGRALRPARFESIIFQRSGKGLEAREFPT